ncbi:hypothetical protein thsps21_33750 [Pseudomonas sp. No.21]|jgi:hypothetical protein|uniref:hypothetical protein n=1 Tax=Pseudomonas TaxID=286 RepID=UPI000DA85967|nr:MULTISPECIES: hypothetical protein [Pseudomonas]MDW3714644.1 hypothetical protein [Pseudomonas sp. 2023EL-01195]PZE13485.1 hypothetical protein DMX10_10050 [Pseudomonas sp. 57B-090624]GJN48208.1 hypothetical protein TUM20249_41940 [Pseudomonas tohonis]
MSLQDLWSAYLVHPHQVVNALALFFALVGAWLLVATRLREQRVAGRLAADSELEDVAQPTLMPDESTLRLNRFFYAFGYFSLAVALGVSWASTQL